MNLNLPSKAFINKFIAKSKFFEKSFVNTKLKNDFSHKIKRVTWEYKLAEETINVAKTNNVEEIQIFKIELKENVIPKNLLKIIDRLIPYPILYAFIYNDHTAFGITFKNEKGKNYYFSDWDEELKFDFNGLNLEKIYHNLIKQFIVKITTKNKNFKDIIKIDSRIKELEKEIVLLKNRIKKEKQFNKKVELNKILIKTKKELEKITL
jgi:hypothetical protein